MDHAIWAESYSEYDIMQGFMQYEYRDRRNHVKNRRFSKLVFQHKLWPFLKKSDRTDL